MSLANLALQKSVKYGEEVKENKTRIHAKSQDFRRHSIHKDSGTELYSLQTFNNTSNLAKTDNS